MVKKLAALYSIFIGICMIGMWGFLLVSGNVPEVKTEFTKIAFHLFSEFSTAILMMVSGIGIIKKRGWAVKLFLVSMGSLMYSVITAAGYYGQSGDFAMLGMFAVFFILAAVFTVQWLKKDMTT